MLRALAHALVKHPTVYDAVQRACGARLVERVLGESIAALSLGGVALDVGGGTGGWRSLLPARVHHICLDLDPLKLRGFKAKYPAGVALMADATRLPLRDCSVETVVCFFVAHHLDNSSLDLMLNEVRRVLKPAGRLIFADPLFVPRRWPGRVLWRYDRGRHPRTLAEHRAVIADRFEIVLERRFAVLHAYVMLVGSKSDAVATKADRS